MGEAEITIQKFLTDDYKENSASSQNADNKSGLTNNKFKEVNNGPIHQVEEKQSSPSSYPGDFREEDTKPIDELKGASKRSDGYQCLNFPDPSLLLGFYNPMIRDGSVTLYPWQDNTLEKWADAKATSAKPYKFALLTCNGSGKDAFIIAGWAVWFALTKIRSRVIITTSSGTQLTAQTEPGIRTLCQYINEFHGCEIFRVRQRYFYCRLSGSEIRLFATDEAGKAEGYHPIEPNAEMTIIVNEAKSVSEEIHTALRRCNGYNYWFEISSSGESVGSFYKAYTHWPNKLRITSYDCPKHLSLQEIEQDKADLGEHSAAFRSIHLALFTSLGGEVIIPQELIDKLLEYFLHNQLLQLKHFQERVGIDLAAGGDENALCLIKGNKAIEKSFVEQDTEVTADLIDHILSVEWKILKSCQNIFADDGGVGRAIIDKLERKGWTINRVLNQARATLNKIYGNRGAENWYRCARILEERCFDVTTLSTKTREQLYTRRYKKSSVGGRIFLESKKEAKAEGRPSPDRADAFILGLTGLTIDDFIKSEKVEPKDTRSKEQFKTNDALQEYYDNEVTFGGTRNGDIKGVKRIFNSLRLAMKR